jgi:DNA-binding HxlR family transcriptional regulator
MRKRCPLFEEIGFVSKRWSLLILRSLSKGSKRFVTIAKDLKGITPRVLAQRLEEMEKIGLVGKKKFREIPPRVEYSLTKKGKCLAKCLEYSK